MGPEEKSLSPQTNPGFTRATGEGSLLYEFRKVSGTVRSKAAGLLKGRGVLRDRLQNKVLKVKAKVC
jgi:hypothetical protein